MTVETLKKDIRKLYRWIAILVMLIISILLISYLTQSSKVVNKKEIIEKVTEAESNFKRKRSYKITESEGWLFPKTVMEIKKSKDGYFKIERPLENVKLWGETNTASTYKYDDKNKELTNLSGIIRFIDKLNFIPSRLKQDLDKKINNYDIEEKIEDFSKVYSIKEKIDGKEINYIVSEKTYLPLKIVEKKDGKEKIINIKYEEKEIDKKEVEPIKPEGYNLKGVNQDFSYLKDIK